MRGSLKSAVRIALRAAGYDVVRTPRAAATEPPADLPEWSRELIMRVAPFTMTSAERVHALVEATRYVIQQGVPGALVECGVWRGGSTMAMIEVLLREACTSRDVFLYDTFEGMTAPTEVDVSIHGTVAESVFRERARGTGGTDWCAASLEEVKANVGSLGYPSDRVHFVPGRVEETIPSQMPDEIALLRLDTDWYESTRHELEHLYPRVVAGGVVIIDDYGHWQGARRAVDEFLASLGKPVLLHRIDYTGRLFVKHSE